MRKRIGVKVSKFFAFLPTSELRALWVGEHASLKIGKLRRQLWAERYAQHRMNGMDICKAVRAALEDLGDWKASLVVGSVTVVQRPEPLKRFWANACLTYGG